MKRFSIRGKKLNRKKQVVIGGDCTPTLFWIFFNKESARNGISIDCGWERYYTGRDTVSQS